MSVFLPSNSNSMPTSLKLFNSLQTLILGDIDHSQQLCIIAQTFPILQPSFLWFANWVEKFNLLIKQFIVILQNVVIELYWGIYTLFGWNFCLLFQKSIYEILLLLIVFINSLMINLKSPHKVLSFPFEPNSKIFRLEVKLYGGHFQILNQVKQLFSDLIGQTLIDQKQGPLSLHMHIFIINPNPLTFHNIIM